MTANHDHDLSDLMHRTAESLDPTIGEHLLRTALADGARRRRNRTALTGISGLAAAAVVAVAATTLIAANQDAPVKQPGFAAGGTAPATSAKPASPAKPTSPPSPTAPTTYAPGSETQVPGGPVIPTDREVRNDAALLDAARDALPAGDVSGLDVERIQSSSPGHTADRTKNGRRIDLGFDGGKTSITVQRWDGYAAVGFADPAVPGSSNAQGELKQKVATTAREACAGAYQSFPAIECTETDGGWYSVGRPSQGDSQPGTYEELLVELYTDDGYVVRVDSYNTPGEKTGPVVSSDPVLNEAESLTLASSPGWFQAR